MGSVQDRVVREMVFRERQEKVAQVTIFTKMLAQVFNMDHDRAFGHLVRDFEGEVFQETYDVELLQRKAAAIKEARKRIAKKRREEARTISQLDRLGQYYDQVLGPDLLPLKPEKKPSKKPTTKGPKPPTITNK